MGDDRAYRISNRLVTAILVVGWLLLLLRPSEPANRVVLGRYSPFAFAVISGWGLGTAAHFVLSRYTRLGRRVFRPNLWLMVAASLVAFGGAELASRSMFPPRDNALVNYLRTDPELGINRLEPHTPGHDRYGFRNRAVPEKVDILFIGDSQTYGNGVPRAETFAARIADLRGVSTYNLALGGWGPAEYYWSLREFGRQLSPELVVVSVYFGNDPFDVLQLDDRLPLFNLPSLEGPEGRELRALHAAFADQLKRATPVERKVEGVLNRLRLWDVATRTLGVTLQGFDFYRRWGHNYIEQGRSAGGQSWLFQESPFFVLDEGPISTIFTPTVRYLAVAEEVDATVPYIGGVLKRTSQFAAELGAELLVVLIPTKEEVYAPLLHERGTPLSPSYEELLRRTAAVKGGLKAAMNMEGLGWIDVTSALQREARRGRRLYPESHDGHPTAAGHRVIAATLQAALEP